MRAPAATDAAPMCVRARGGQPPPCESCLWAQRTFFATRCFGLLGLGACTHYGLAPGGARAPTGPGVRAGSSGAAGARGAKGTGARRFCGLLFGSAAWLSGLTCVVLVFLQRKVQLLSPDKQTFEVEWDVAMRSTVVKQMLEGRLCAPVSASRAFGPVDAQSWALRDLVWCLRRSPRAG